MAAGVSAATEGAERNLVITRVLDARRDLVFKAWTEREHLVHWSAPRGFTITHIEGDARQGGPWRCCMRSPSGVDYWLGGVYREIVEPERVVFTHAWDDEEGRPGHDTLVTVTFAEHGQQTKLTFQQTRFGSARVARPASRGLDGYDRCVAQGGDRDGGGHFAAFEQPALFTQELRDCFRSVR